MIILNLIQKCRVRKFRILSHLKTIGRPHLNQPLHAVGSGTLTFDGSVKIGVFPSPGYLSGYAYIEARNPKASVRISDGTWINNGFVAIAEHTQITIGKRCLIGTNCEILDSNFHGLSIKNRGCSAASWAKPVVVEDDVFLGSNVKIQKGVTIGYGSVIANGSIVTKNIPPLSIAGGNPARVIKSIDKSPDSASF